MKWLIAAVVAVVLGVFAYLQFHAVKTTYVNGLPPFTTLPGREYILQRDLYIFKFKDRNSDWPLIGTKERVSELPSKITEANVGIDFPNVRILGVLRVGDDFRIASVRREVSHAVTTVSFEVLLKDENSRKYPRLDAYWIMDHSPEKTGGAPTIIVDYAAPLRRE